MHTIVIDLAINPEEYLKNYQLPGINVVAKSLDGRVVHLPATILRNFVTRDGVNGRFRIHFNDEGKYQAIDKL